MKCFKLYSVLFFFISNFYSQTGYTQGFQNVSLHKPVLVDSELRAPENVGSFAVDGINEPSNNDSRWVSAAGYPHFIVVDLEAQYQVGFVQFFTGYNGYGNPVNDFQIQFWDGSTWQDIVSRVDNSKSVVTEFFAPVTTNMIRLFATRGSDQYLRLYEINIYAFSGGGGVGTGGLWNAGDNIIHTDKLVGIGTNAPDQQLTVKGSIHAEEVNIDLDVPAPDYVFEDGYDLPELHEIKQFIKINGHLPYMPSAKQMANDGANLSANQMSLLRTVEELMLHVIELKAQLDELKIVEPFSQMSKQ